VAGIVVGVVVLLLLVGTLGFVMWRRKRATVQGKVLSQEPGEYLGAGQQWQRAELGNESKVEMRHETDAVDTVIHEIGER